MRRLFLLLPVGCVLALPSGAAAAGVRINPEDVTVGESRIAEVEVANPTKRILRGSARLVVGGRSVASRTLTLPAREVRTVTLRLSPAAYATLRRTGSRRRAVVVLTLAPRGGRTVRVRRAIGLRPAAAGGASTPPAPVGVPQTPGPVTPPAPPTSPPAAPGTPASPPAASRGQWVARMGDTGAYDDFTLTVENGRLQFTRSPLVPVVCAENGGGFNRSAGSLERFDAAGPWTVGEDGQTTTSGIAVNPLVGSGERSITAKVTGTRHTDDRLTGTLGMSFSDSRLDFSTYPNRIIFVNCFGSQSFEAIPAP